MINLNVPGEVTGYYVEVRSPLPVLQLDEIMRAAMVTAASELDAAGQRASVVLYTAPQGRIHVTHYVFPPGAAT
jgi:hypothetical protein